MGNEDNVLTRLHDLLMYLVPQLAKFPRDQKFVLGDRIQTRLMDVQEQCVRAYFGTEKQAHLVEANLTVESVRHLLRLAHSLRLMSAKAYGVASEKLDTVGRMLGGWIKSTRRGRGAESRASVEE